MNSAVSRALIYSPPSKTKWLHLWIPLRGSIYFVSRFLVFSLLICNREYVIIKKTTTSSAIKSESGRTGARNWKGLNPDSYKSKCQSKINPWYRAKITHYLRNHLITYACAQVYGEIYFSFKSPKTIETSLQPFKFAFLFVSQSSFDNALPWRTSFRGHPS